MDRSIIRIPHKPDEDYIQLDDVLSMLNYFKEITAKTGSQVQFEYEDHAFPYEVSKVEIDGTDVLHLVGREKNLYHHLLITINHTESESEENSTQVTIHFPGDGTNGDKNKANELGKFLAKKWKGSLTLFNGRVMPFG